MSITHEAAFEASIESDLLAAGWGKVDPAGYDRAAGLVPDEVIAFVRASQPKAWEQLSHPARWGGVGASAVPEDGGGRGRPPRAR